MRLLIFGPDGKLLRQLDGVTRAHVTMPGALVCHLDPTAPMPRWVAAPGAWAHIEEWRDLDTDPAAGRILARPDGFLPDHALAGSMTEQMKIICDCAGRRCPVTVTPPSKGTRAWWRGMLLRDTAEITAGASPFRQCSRGRAHDGEHVYPDDGWTWPYGIHNHHPYCPRHPRPAAAVEGEGQPDGAGATPEPEQQPEQGPPDFEHGTGYPAPEPPAQSWAAAGATTAFPPYRDEPAPADRITRPYVAAIDTLPVRRPGATALPPGRIYQAGRIVWGSCAIMTDDDGEDWCELHPGHAGAHRTHRGGERHTW